MSFAGPLANLFAMIISAFLFALLVTKGGPELLTVKTQLIREMLEYSVVINIILFAFNLLPFPGFDGSRMLESQLGYNALRKYQELSQYLTYLFYGLILLSFAGVNVFGFIFKPVFIFANLVTGLFQQILA